MLGEHVTCRTCDVVHMAHSNMLDKAECLCIMDLAHMQVSTGCQDIGLIV